MIGIKRYILLLILYCFSSAAYPQYTADDAKQCLDEVFLQQMDAEDYYMCGLAYGFGIGVPKNFKKRILNLEIAAKKGHIKSAVALFTIYADESSKYYNGEKIFTIVKNAASHIENVNDNYIYAFLGALYSDGIGVEANKAKAIFYYKKSVDINLGESAMQSRQLLCEIYYDDGGKDMKLDTAIHWCKQALDAGSEDALYMLTKISAEQNLKNNSKYHKQK